MIGNYEKSVFMKRVLSILLALVMLLSLAACGSNQSEAQPDAQAENPADSSQQEAPADGETGSPAAGEYYNTYLSADPTSMDISRVSDTYSGAIINNVMEGLVRLGESNGEYEMKPGDAQTWELDESGTVWTFHLGDNKWSDGQPVTAQDYVYSLQRSVDPATGCPNEWFLYPIVGYDAIRNDGASVDTLGVKALDEKTLEITLAFAMPSFLEMCSGTIYYPLRQDKVEEFGEQYGTEPEYTIFNGPYTMTEWTHNSKIVLTKNENYWDAANVSIETVNVSILSGSITIYNAFETGDLDYVSTGEGEWIDKFYSRDDTVYIQVPTATLASSAAVFSAPKHPYTQALIAAIPEVDFDGAEQKKQFRLQGEVPSPIDPPLGCRFAARCKYATDICRQQMPVLTEVEPDHFVACHRCL